MMNTLIILNFATSIVAFVTLAWKRHPIMAIVALFCVLLYGYGLWNVGLNVEGPLSQTLQAEERYGMEVVHPALMGGWTALMLTNVCMALYPWLKRWSVVSWLLMVVAVGLVVGHVSPINAIEGLFSVCCAIMAEIAIITGLSYLHVCTLENIHLHSLLPTLFAIPAFIVSLRGLTKGQSREILPFLLSGVWLALNVSMTIVVWCHYIYLPIMEACGKCVRELKDLSGHTWSGYVIANILIFVVAFLIDLFISWLMYRYAKNHCKSIEGK